MTGVERLLALSEDIGIATVWRVGDGQRVSVRRVSCAACGATAEKRHKPNAPPDQVRQSFERAGWAFGKRVLCPACARRRPAGGATLIPATAALAAAIPAAVAPEATLPAAAIPTAAVALAPAALAPVIPAPVIPADSPPPSQESDPMAALKPRIPTVKEVLRIGEELDLHFADGRYRAGQSDQVLADRLDLPRAIVTRVREEGYGPLKGDPEVEALRSDLDTLGGVLTDFRARLARLEQRGSGGAAR